MTFHHAKEGIVLQGGNFSDGVTSIKIGKSTSAHGVVGCTLRCGVGDPSSSPVSTRPVSLDRGPSTGSQGSPVIVILSLASNLICLESGSIFY